MERELDDNRSMRFFSTEGPVRPDDHYAIPPLERIRRVFAPLLFDDETLPEARRTRDPVAPAKPTERAQYKKARRRTGLVTPLHGLDTLIAELATRCRNTCRVPADPAAPPLSLLTEPTPTRRRAAHLIDMLPVPGTPRS